MWFSSTSRAELPLAVILTVGGIALTTWAAFTHAGQAVVPGATLIFVGGAWLGNALARHDVRLLPTSSRADAVEREAD